MSLEESLVITGELYPSFSLQEQIEPYKPIHSSELLVMGVDVITKNDVIIGGCEEQTVPVEFPEGSLPGNIDRFEFVERQDEFGHSTRSRLALSFVEVLRFIRENDQIHAVLKKHVNRPSFIPAGEGITQIHGKGDHPLTGIALLSAIGNEQLIVGEKPKESFMNYGKTWWFYDGEGDRLDDPFDDRILTQALGVALALSSERKVIPDSIEPIDVFTPNDFRAYLTEQVYRTLGNNEPTHATIMSSADILQLNGTHILIPKFVAPGVEQINSPLFESGRYPVPKLFEFLGDTRTIDHVNLQVYPATSDYQIAAK